MKLPLSGFNPDEVAIIRIIRISSGCYPDFIRFNPDLIGMNVTPCLIPYFIPSHTMFHTILYHHSHHLIPYFTPCFIPYFVPSYTMFYTVLHHDSYHVSNHLTPSFTLSWLAGLAGPGWPGLAGFLPGLPGLAGLAWSGWSGWACWLAGWLAGSLR